MRGFSPASLSFSFHAGQLWNRDGLGYLKMTMRRAAVLLMASGQKVKLRGSNFRGMNPRDAFQTWTWGNIVPGRLTSTDDQQCLD